MAKTDTVESGAPAAAEPRRADTGALVKYTGSAGIREITRGQWKAAGVENQDTVVWNSGNDYSLPIENFNAAALEVLKRDRNIKVQ